MSRSGGRWGPTMRSSIWPRGAGAPGPPSGTIGRTRSSTSSRAYAGNRTMTSRIGSDVREERDPHVVAADHGEDHGVQAIQRPAMGAEDVAGILDPRVALDQRLEQIADRPEDRHRDA